MSMVVKMQPPQTYSRLFRPWDMKCAKDSASELSSNPNSPKCSSSSFVSSEIKVNQMFCESNLMPEYMMTDQFSAMNCFSSENPYAHLLGVPASPDFCYPGAISVPLLGMEGSGVKMMEQEYLRVLAEDAQNKAHNARKQRPKKFKCSHCDVAFSNNGQLKGHVRIHTGERPFKCDVSTCGKTFTRNEELTRHKRIHTGLRPFACTACGKKFGRRDHLKKHMKTHMPQERQLSPAIFIPMYPYLYGY